jgi:hypothetical protein
VNDGAILPHSSFLCQAAFRKTFLRGPLYFSRTTKISFELRGRYCASNRESIAQLPRMSTTIFKKYFSRAAPRPAMSARKSDFSSEKRLFRARRRLSSRAEKISENNFFA